MSDTDKTILVECDISAHASPRWRSAKTDQVRIQKNEKLARSRGQAVKSLFQQQLKTKLSKYKIDFKFDQEITDKDSLTSDTVVIGDISKGQRDSLVASGGNKSNDDQLYRRVDVEVRIKRTMYEIIPTTVVYKYQQPTKTEFWYASVAFAAGLHLVAGVNFLIVELRNMWNQKATGIAYAAGVGVGESGIGLAIAEMTKDKILRIAASASFSDETAFTTDKKYGFDDFHVRRIRYTAATAQAGITFEASYLSFSNMGDGAQSIPVGGVGIGPDAGLSLSTGVGLLFLTSVPDDWVILNSNETEWKSTGPSDWITKHNVSIFFESGSYDLVKYNSEIDTFTSAIVKDFLAK